MKGYRIGAPEETTAAKVLDFEFHELHNVHLLEDLAGFLNIEGPLYEGEDPWSKVLDFFKCRHKDITGIWLTRSKEAAKEYYGRFGSEIEVYEYDPALIVCDLGDDGIFVLAPKCVGTEVID